MNTMNIFTFNEDTIKDLKPGDVFLSYEKASRERRYNSQTEEYWSYKMVIFQGFSPASHTAAGLVFEDADKSRREMISLLNEDLLSKRVFVRLSPHEHPLVVQSGFDYVFSD